MEGRCLIIKLDAGCKDWNWTDLTCIACSYRYYKNNNNKCMAVSDYCQGYNEDNGDCTSCYGGYVLRGG